MFEKVLVAMDLSPATEALVSALPSMREFGTAELHLVHVAKPFGEPVSRSLRQVGDLKERLDGLAESLRTEGFQVTVDVPSGVPADEITRLAKNHDPDIILVGSRSRSRIQEAFLGSVSWEVLRQARRPVFLQRIEANRPDPEAALESRGVGLPNRVLHPTDFSEAADRARPWLLKLASASLPITLLHVLPVAAGQEREATRGRLQDLAEELRGAGSQDVQVDVRTGSPHEEILAAGGRSSETLVVMSSHGRGFLPGVVLGNESRQVARLASARVLLVPTRDGDA